jgi:hypothetical protein
MLIAIPSAPVAQNPMLAVDLQMSKKRLPKIIMFLKSRGLELHQQKTLYNSLHLSNQSGRAAENIV